MFGNPEMHPEYRGRVDMATNVIHTSPKALTDKYTALEAGYKQALQNDKLEFEALGVTISATPEGVWPIGFFGQHGTFCVHESLSHLFEKPERDSNIWLLPYEMARRVGRGHSGPEGISELYRKLEAAWKEKIEALKDAPTDRQEIEEFTAAGITLNMDQVGYFGEPEVFCIHKDAAEKFKHEEKKPGFLDATEMANLLGEPYKKAAIALYSKLSRAWQRSTRSNDGYFTYEEIGIQGLTLPVHYGAFLDLGRHKRVFHLHEEIAEQLKEFLERKRIAARPTPGKFTQDKQTRENGIEETQR